MNLKDLLTILAFAYLAFALGQLVSAMYRKMRLAAFCSFAKAGVVIIVAVSLGSTVNSLGNGTNPVIVYLIAAIFAFMNISVGRKFLRMSKSPDQ